ncbi:GumC family protein [Yoonia sediminilitoris]|uniref:non-specific protein-tyrosine kinase n=1 Tax=Yoonia sediminilitoris TaxID=1286148 RepID=A0A2T6KB72_9RHOB|nr:polysaccharide biosynthesis tyrosine autokinase [Yoonia sediminilitoris]PUB12125.1 capsular exopolysaccharide synthesis family protein [Yoonia sediminilitoris]RCW92952.1 capsular exopolysaccharide synthesis family protein [Yoonia sediminilitoris]
MAKLVEDTTLKIQNLSAIEVERIEPLDVMQLVRRVWQGKLLITGTTLLAVVAAGYYAFAIASPRYAATATLEIDARTGPMSAVEDLARGLTTDQSSLNTEVAILRSRHLLEQVIAALDLLNDPAFNRHLTPIPRWSVTGMRNQARNLLTGQVPPPPTKAAVVDKTVENLTNALRVDVLRDTYIFRITAQTGDPQKSATIANTLAQTYIADQITSKQQATESAVNWLSERVYDLQIELEAKETAVNDLIMSHQANDTAVLEALSRQSIETQNRLQDTRRAMQSTQGKLLDLGAEPAISPISTGNERARLAASLSRFAEQEAALKLFQDSIDQQLDEQSATLVRQQQLRREADATRVLYETFLARLQETSIQRGLQHADSRILTHATAGTYVAPRKLLILLMATLLGSALGVAIVLLRSALRKGFVSAEGMASTTGEQVLTQVPRLKIRKPGQLLDYLNAKPMSAAAEAFRNLRTSLLLSDPDRVPQVILSTSSVAGEGKTTQSIALAHHLASLKKNVLLVEADIRQPSFLRYLDCNGHDFGQVVAGQIPLSQATSRDPRLGADILASTSMRQNPADLFSSDDCGAFLDALRAQYDFIILDAPPVLPVPDARLLAQHCDAVIYNVRWERTDKRLVASGLHALTAVRAPLAGLVLSQIDAKRGRHYGGVHLADYGRAYYQN